MFSEGGKDMSLKVRLPYDRLLKESRKLEFDAEVERRSQEIFRAYEGYVIDIVLIAVSLAMIEEFHWGSGKRAKRVHRLLAAVEKTIQDACDRYDYDCAFTALKNRLDNYGKIYERKSKK